MTTTLIIGLLIPLLGTMLGSAFVFFMRGEMSVRLQKTLLGFASGVMVAASVWSLLIPAMEMSSMENGQWTMDNQANAWSVFPAAIGFLLGMGFLLLIDELTPHLHIGTEKPEGMRSHLSKTAMLALAVTIHNLPEGMAVGVVFAGADSGTTNISLASALAVAVGIAIQNVPEGAIISMPMRAAGNSRWRSFIIGSLSGAVEPIGAIAVLLLASKLMPALPYMLAFAAGAMFYVVVEELIPEASSGQHSNLSTIGFAIGFVIMMVLDKTSETGFLITNDDNAVNLYEQATFIPQAPDYNDAAMWVTADGDIDDTGADIFYVVSTWEEDWTQRSMVNGQRSMAICHYADVWNPEHRGRMGDLEINKVAAYMSPGNRFFAPFYRHTTIEAWMTQNEDTIRNRTRLSMGDVCAAFDHFQAHRDTSRPLIIAGFSQGGLAVVELLKHIDDETYSQLAAAYVLGYKVTNADMAQCCHIRPAEGETDTGVTICYNTVKDVKYVIPVISASDICINPVNWRTDATPATLHDTITVTVAPSHHVLVVSGYSGSEYAAYKGFINVGDIHSCEPWLYSECLAKNIKVRAKEWRKLKGLGNE
jgi:zinc transporter ZupT